jgi:hypothetical protein
LAHIHARMCAKGHVVCWRKEHSRGKYSAGFLFCVHIE